MTIAEIQNQIHEWHIAQFGKEPDNEKLGKLDEECCELRDEYQYGYPIEDQAEEAADCMIVLLCWMARNGRDAEAEILMKLEIVKARNQGRLDRERGL